MPTPASDIRAHIDRRRRQMLLALAAAPTLAPALTSAGRRGLQWLDPRPSAPALLLRAADGTLYDRSAVSDRVLIVNFWSIWCRPCREEMPALQRLHSRFGDKGLAVWGVAVGDAPESVAEFGSTQGLRFPLLPDPERETLATWDVSALPTTAVVDKRGRIAFRVIGDAAWDKPPLSDHVAALVQGP